MYGNHRIYGMMNQRQNGIMSSKKQCTRWNCLPSVRNSSPTKHSMYAGQKSRYQKFVLNLSILFNLLSNY